MKQDTADMFTNCGKSGAIIYSSESIYKNKSMFKSSSEDPYFYNSVSEGRTIVPKYKPEWTVTGTTIDATNKALEINLKGAVNTANYTSNVTTALSADNISIWIDGTELTKATKSVSTADPATGASVTHTITITNFEESLRQAGKSYKEWSGNITLKIAGRGEDTGTYTKKVLVDSYGNQSMSQIDTSGTWIDIDFKDETPSSANTAGKLFADFITPKFTYEYKNTTIDHGTKKVTIVFSVADKYFNTSILSADSTASKIAVTVGGKTTTNATKKLTKLSDITDTIDGTADTKVGEKYQLEITNLDQGGGGDYSGIMTLAFEEGTVVDKSGNKSIPKTLTIGIDDPSTGDGDNNGIIVDVVDPVWKVENININKANKTVTADVIATDKYFTGTENSTLTTSDITLSVDGETDANEVITKKLSAPTFSENSSTGLKEIKYKLTLSNWEQAAKQEGKSFLEYSGTAKITIKAGTAKDDANQSATASKLYDSTGTKTEKLHIGDFVNYDADTWTSSQISSIKTGLKTDLAIANGTRTAPTSNFQFGGFVSGMSKSSNASPQKSAGNGYNFIKKDGGTLTGWRVFDITGNNVTLISAGNPELFRLPASGNAYQAEYVLSGAVNSKWSSGSTNKSKYTIRNWNAYVNRNQYATSATTLTKTKLDSWYAKYITGGSTANTATDSVFQRIYTDSSKYRYQNIIDNYSYYWVATGATANNLYNLGPKGRVLSQTSGSSAYAGIRVLVNLTNPTFNATRSGTTTLSGGNMTNYGGSKTYNKWEFYSTSNGKSDGVSNSSKEQTLTLGHVDFIKPRIEKVSATRDTSAKTETIIFNVIDKYLNTTDQVTANEIAVLVDKETTTGITKTLTRVTANDVSATVKGSTQVVSQQYKLVLSNFEQSRTSIDSARDFTDWSGTVSIEIAEGAVKDKTSGSSVNTNDKTTIDADFVDFIEPKVTYQYATSDINYDDKTFIMKFEITDKYYKTDTVITTDNLADYLTIKVDGDDITTNDKVTKKIIETETITAGTTAKPMNKTVDGTVQTGLTDQVVGKRYTLELSNLEQAANIGKYLDYSGVITVAVKAGIMKDSGPAGDNTNVNGNVTTTITSGVKIPSGTGTGTVVDVVDPIWERAGTATTEPLKRTASLVIRGTDKYFASCNLTSDKIRIIVNDVEQTEGITVELTEDTSVSLAYGVQYKVKITGFVSNAYQVKMIIPAGTLVDQSGNVNKETEFLLYSCLKKTNTETNANSPFLGNKELQRKKIEKIILQDNWDGVNSTRWDVSAQEDGSIIGWYETTSRGTYIVHIGSYSGINANMDSSYLFSFIGSDENCAATGDTNATDGTQKPLIENIELLNVDTVDSMECMFELFGYATMKSFSLGTNFNTSNVTEMNGMFKSTGRTAMTSLDLGEKFDTSSVIDMSYMFEGTGFKAMTSLNLGDKFDTSSVIDMGYMFNLTGYTAMTSLDLGNKFDTSNVTNMQWMFNGTGRTAMTSLDLGEKFDTSNVTDMTQMFDGTGYAAMTSLNLGEKFDTSKVTSMQAMFAGTGYTAMTSLDLGDKFDTINVTNMLMMFYKTGYTAMKSLDLGDKFNTSNVTNMRMMFYETGYTAMTSLDLGEKFDTSSVTNMIEMFGKTGYTAMTSLDLGPVFTRIPDKVTVLVNNRPALEDAYLDMFKDCGKSGATIYAPESIYKNRTSFKLSSTDTETEAGTIAVDDGVTVVPKYKPEWTVTGTTIDETNKSIKINLKGAVNTENYTSNVTTKLTNSDISVRIDGTVLTGVATVTSDADPTTGASVTHTITISNFEETLRQAGKSYKEWSGNIALKIDGRSESTDSYSKNILVDSYGNQSMGALDSAEAWTEIILKDATPSTANTANKMFTDFITPEFTYEYKNTTIDHGNKKVTIVFSVSDKYFNTSKLTSDTNASNIGIEVDGTPATNATKKLTKLSDITATVNEVANTKVGEKYQLEVTNLDQGGGGDYSGIMNLSFEEGTVTDKSGNKSIAKTITIGIDDPTTGDGDNSGVIVDVVSPVWRTENIIINKASKTVTVDLIVADKYLTDTVNSKLTTSNITVSVDGDANADKAITKTLSDATYSTNATTGLNEIKYTLTLSNFEQGSKQTDKTFLEYSGTTKITIATGVVTDQYTNTNKEQTFELGHVDFIKPRIEKVSSTRDTSAKTETIVFNVIDKYLETSDAVTSDEISVYVDGETASTLTKTLTRVTANDVSATVNGTSQVVSQQYKLVLSNFEKTRNDKDYKDWSGTVRIDIAANAVKDKTSGGAVNTNDKTQITGNFVDFIKPDLKYVHQSSDINKDGKSYTMTFTVTDKYYNSGKLGIDDLTIKMQNGQMDSSGNEIVYNLKDEPVTISLQDADIIAANVPITNTSGTIQTVSSLVIGHTYTLTISNLEELERKTGHSTADYSGIVTVAVAGNKILDRGPAGDATSSGSVSANGNSATTITSGVNIPGGTSPSDAKVVDVVKPIWEKMSSTARAIDPANHEPSTATITFKGTDSYYASNSLTADKIKVIVNGSEVSSNAIEKSLGSAKALNEQRKEFGKTTTVTKQYGVQYTLTLTGFAQNADQVKIQIPADTLIDESGNGNKATEMIVYNTLKKTDTETAETSGFLGSASSTNANIKAIQRKNIENVTFESSVPSSIYNASTKTIVDTSKAWDVSARGDNSIIAWYETSNSNGALKVHIGSNDEIFGNQDSSYLFCYIGCTNICTATESITNIGLLNVGSVTNMASMFLDTGYTAMTSFDLGDKFDTSNVTNMEEMFEGVGCIAAMTSLNLGNKFNTSKVTDMSSMFAATGMTAMTRIDLGDKFDTSNVTNMEGMFRQTGYYSLTSLNLGDKFNTSNVTNMSRMFGETGYTAMTSLDLGENFDTSNVTNMSMMFFRTGCTAMTSLNLGDKFNTSNVTDMSNMFFNTGTTAMKILNLGPAFTKVANRHSNFMTNCGTTGLVIYAPESIYSNKTFFYSK